MAIDHVLLRRITKALADFLERELPRLGTAGWWNSLVLPALTPMQRDMIARRRVTSLSGLDLSALLRALDRNWNGLSASLKWLPDVRNFIKETQSLRNRWAHTGSDAADAEDSYRDLDTLQRLIQAIGDVSLAAEIGQAKREVLAKSSHTPNSAATADKTVGLKVDEARSPTNGNEARVPRGDAEAKCDLVLIGCVKTKLLGRHKAKDLFISPLFVGRRRRAEALRQPWFILSARYGLLDPEAVVDSYDVSLNNAGFQERRRWSARVIAELQKRVGDLRGKAIELHAGAAYRNFGLTQGLLALGASVVVPLEHARQGEQLAWYSDYGAANDLASVERQATGGPTKPTHLPEQTEAGLIFRVEIFNAKGIGPFSYRWPTNREEFASGWEFDVRCGGGIHHRLRHGIGKRHCFGRERVHTVTWLDGHPMVEGAEAEDYANTRDIVSILKRAGSNHDARSPDEIDPAYSTFRVVFHRDAITATNARRGLAVRIREDDLDSWAKHALLRLRGRDGKPPEQARRTPPNKPPGGNTSAPSESSLRGDVVTAILAFGRQLSSSAKASFTPDPEADAFVRRDAFAFLVAVVCDEQIRFEAAWEAPLRLRNRLGHWDIQRIADEPTAVRAAFAESPALHRWVTVTPDRVVSAAARVIAEYSGDASQIWCDRPTARALRERLEGFEGIGQKKSAMAVELLSRELRVPLDDLAGSDVAVDVHVRRVFLRTGLADRDDVQHIVSAARAAHPTRPGELDNPAWEIGRQ